MSTVPAPITIYQKVYVEGAKNAHGNPAESWDAPVPRKVQSINELGRRGSSHEIVSPDYLNRIETLLEIGVPDVTLYKPKDIVLIGPGYAGSPTDGVAFHVEGDLSDKRLGPFPLLNRILGGAVRVRRVT
jgi:hypothetical protein